ncbi:hypothetical protein FRC15_002036 [Serendipita sp. 397]|nr:hypothetical protein FRC15_002036 [Serendipita sp. 397]
MSLLERSTSSNTENAPQSGLNQPYHQQSSSFPLVLRPQRSIVPGNYNYNPTGPSFLNRDGSVKTYRMLLKDRLQRKGLLTTYTVEQVGAEHAHQWKGTLSLNAVVIGQSGLHTHKAGAKEEAAERALEWLDANNI